MEVKFPFQIVEMLNGVLAVVLLWMLLFLGLHLHHAWRILSAHWGRGTAVLKMYHTNKPEIALTLFIMAFFFRTILLWYVRWLRNHHLDGLYLVVENDAITLIICTGIMIAGIACWVRVISPFSGRMAIGLWSAMLATSLLFGIGMHYLF